MNLPENITALLEDLAEREGVVRLKSAYEGLSLRYRGSGRTGASMLNTQTEAVAYAIARMPATYSAVYTALKYINEVFDLKGIASLCDAGAGTGAATLAVQQYTDTLQKTCIERESVMRALGSEFVNALWLAADISEVKKHTADMVIASYVLNELAPSSRLDTVKEMWQASKKMLVIIENGTPEGAAVIGAIRNWAYDIGAHIIAPCPNSNACPIKGEDWCHFTCRVQRSKIHKLLKGGDAPYEDEKFSYIALCKEPVEQVSARILRHPKIESGKITLTLCTQNGVKTAIKTKKEKEAFKAARKASAGESFSY